MQKSIEKDIKKAFDVWDQQKNAIGFDKEKVWKSINRPAKRGNVFIFSLSIAASVVVCFLSALSVYVMNQNQKLKVEKELLSNEISVVELEQEVLKRKLLEQKTDSIKVIYKTVPLDNIQDEPRYEISNNMGLDKELLEQNDSMRQKLFEYQQIITSYENSIVHLNEQLQRRENFYSRKIESIEDENSPSLGITVNTEAFNSSEDALAKKTSPKKVRKGFIKIGIGKEYENDNAQVNTSFFTLK